MTVTPRELMQLYNETCASICPPKRPPVVTLSQDGGEHWRIVQALRDTVARLRPSTWKIGHAATPQAYTG